MIYAPATKPQVRVKVNGIDAVCPDMNCDYVYTTSPSEVTAQTLAANLVDITVTGTALPTTATNVRVVVGNAQCGTVTVNSDATEITCTLAHQPAAGSWDVQVIDDSGLAPIAAGTAKIYVSLTVSAVSPSTGLNQLGGDVLTITGAGFDADTTATTVVFNEDSTACDIESATPTEIKCKIAGFDAATISGGASATYTVKATVNAVEDTSQTVTRLDTKQSGQTVVPSSVSPVLLTDLVVTLESTYQGTMTSALDLKATLNGKTNTTITRPLFVKSIDATAKTVTITFPGADSGEYWLALEGTGVGRIDQIPLLLTVEGVITGISPL